MMEWEKSSQCNSWMFTPDYLQECRKRANHEAHNSWKRAHIEAGASSPNNNQPPGADHVDTDTTEKPKKKKNIILKPYLVQHFASNYKQRRDQNPNEALPTNPLSSENNNSSPTDIDSHFLTTQEEQHLLQFYAGMLPSIIGPNASSRRLFSKDPKVTATANVFYRRFFCSNSIVHHDPKCILLASAFLASKVEESMVHVQSLEDATVSLNLGKVSSGLILEAELQLVEGLHFELLCSHPYKALIALWEDLRTCLKGDAHSKLAYMEVGTSERISSSNISSGDLKPIYDQARQIVEDVSLSDIPLLFSSGHIALGAMMLANQMLLEDTTKFTPTIDFGKYLHHRFETSKRYSYSSIEALYQTLQTKVLPILKECKVPGGIYGCGNYPVNTETLKEIHKKLKAIRVWGKGGQDGKKKKKKKKRSLEGEVESSEKKRKLE